MNRHWTKQDKLRVKLELDDWIGSRLTDSEFQEWVKWYGKEIDNIVVQLNKRIKKPMIKTNGNITDEMIARAKEYDISRLFPNSNRNGMVSCPFHGEDKRPSASIKTGGFVCFACGEKGDAIKIYQKLNNCSFQDAVKGLQ